MVQKAICEMILSRLISIRMVQKVWCLANGRDPKDNLDETAMSANEWVPHRPGDQPMREN